MAGVAEGLIQTALLGEAVDAGPAPEYDELLAHGSRATKTTVAGLHPFVSIGFAE